MIVLDCSAAIEIVERTEKGRALQALMLSNEEVISVDLLCAELTSVIRKHVIREEIAPQHAGRFLAAATGMVDRFVPAHELEIETLNESVRLCHSPYDMFYFVLARRTGATLFTTDEKLATLAESNGVNTISLATL